MVGPQNRTSVKTCKEKQNLLLLKHDDLKLDKNTDYLVKKHTQELFLTLCNTN